MSLNPDPAKQVQVRTFSRKSSKLQHPPSKFYKIKSKVSFN